MSNGNGNGNKSSGGLHDEDSYIPPAQSEKAKVHDDKVIFPIDACQDMKRRAIGSVILGDRAGDGINGDNPDGFLRKIKSVTCGSETVVETDPATLDEAFDDLKLDAGFSIPACNEENGGPGGKNLGVSYGGTLFEEKSTAQTADGKTVPFTASATLDSAICVAPKFKVKADVGFLEVRSFEASITAELDARLLVGAKVTVDSTDPKVLAELANKPLSKQYAKVLASGKIPITTLKIGFIGLPAFANYETTLTCDFDFTAPVEAKVGATVKGSLTAGLLYQNSKLSPVFDKNIGFNTVPPQFTKDGMLRARCTVTPKIELKMFGMSTAKLTPRVYAGLGATQTCGAKDAQGVTQRKNDGEVEGGASASIYGEINILDIKKFKKECTLFDERGSLQYSRTYPQPGGASATCTPPEALPNPRPLPVNPQACFGDDTKAPETKGPIPGTCTHDVCTAGVKLGQTCDDCTMKVCDADPYCCDTYWGQSCFETVRKVCGKVCPKP